MAVTNILLAISSSFLLKLSGVDCIVKLKKIPQNFLLVTRSGSDYTNTSRKINMHPADLVRRGAFRKSYPSEIREIFEKDSASTFSRSRGSPQLAQSRASG